MVTIGYQLVGLDARTGLPLEGFGNAGVVDLKQGMDQALDPITGELALNSAPVVARDLVIVGASHRPGGAPESRTNAKGYVRAFDVRTGERRWIFHTIPLADEFGNDTWGADSSEYSGNTGMWAPFSVDEELGIAYLPIELSTGRLLWGTSARRQLCLRNPSSRSTWKPANGSGTTNLSITESGTMTFHARPS